MNTITLTMEATEENLRKLLRLFEAGPTILTIKGATPSEASEKKEEPKADPIKSSETGAASTVKTAETPSQESASEKKVTKEEVRAAALALKNAGRADALKKIFAELGGKKLSDFDQTPEKYPELLKKIQEAANA